MKKPILILMLLAVTVIAKAQKIDTSSHHKPTDDIMIDGPVINSNTNTKVDTNVIYSAVEVQPRFNGSYYDYFRKNQQLPEGTDPGKVIVTFVVERNGSLSNIRILRSPGDVYTTEALRLLKASPKWIPGMQSGHTVRAYFTVPIDLRNDD